MKTLVEYCKIDFKFEKLVNQTLYYVAPDGFICRIPVEDLGGSMIRADEKGIMIMKWIRKELTEIK